MTTKRIPTKLSPDREEAITVFALMKRPLEQVESFMEILLYGT